MNGLLGQKIAIVTPRPQTTRTRQLGILTEADYQVIFVDTPGMLKPRHKLDEFMLDTAVEALQDANVVLWLVDASEPPGPGDRAIAEQLQGVETPVILGMNKSDLLAPADVIPRSEAYRALLPEAEWILFSALGGLGLKELLAMLVRALPEGPRYYSEDEVTETYLRDIAAELIREQVFLQMREELPYGTAVKVEHFEEKENGVTVIGATIYVERENHRKMLIGVRGSQLRKIGAAARKEIEELVEGRVFLELWVKVEEQWRRKESALKRLGYSKE
jgi:GTP-binding protein Era